jgi:glycolate oxidase iron-sulfur subunit
MSTLRIFKTPSTTAKLIDYTRSLDCIHCGLCLTTCPTYRMTGSEASSPRGRVHLMRAVAEQRLPLDAAFAEEMDFCLVCRHCESVCPAGVQFGAMMETARDAVGRVRPRGLVERSLRWIGFRGLLEHRWALRLVFVLLGVAENLRFPRRLAPLFGARGRALANLPPVPARRSRRALPRRHPARGTQSATVLVLEGCVMRHLYGRVNRATLAVLSAAGVESRVPTDAMCCGALHAHNGELEGARRAARATIEAFELRSGESLDPLPIVVNSAGCGAHMKEYGRLFSDDEIWRARAEAFAARVQDASEFLGTPERLDRLRSALADSDTPREELTITYDDPCHLCHGQQIRGQPRALLDLLPGVRRVELTDSEACCGSAGIYSLLRPQDSAAVLAPKIESLRASGTRVLVSANPGCQMQWESGVRAAGLDLRVAHWVELLADRLEP